MKSRLGAMLGLKNFTSAATTIQGIELMHRIRKGQFELPALASQGELRPKSGLLSSMHDYFDKRTS